MVHTSRGNSAKNVSAAKGFLEGLDNVLGLDENCADLAVKIMGDLETKGIGLDPLFYAIRGKYYFHSLSKPDQQL